jgi:hypothetical protein
MDVKRFFARMPYMFRNFNLVDHKNADFVITSRIKRMGKNQKTIFYTPENVRPNLSVHDWAFSFDYDEELKNPRHMRLPNYVRVGAGMDLIKKGLNIRSIMDKKYKFCAYVQRHTTKVRRAFVNSLSQYKRVDAPSTCCKNMMGIDAYLRAHNLPFDKNDWYKRKIKFYEQYKFVIAFEHTSYPGYTTEKMYHAMLANCIPIYWGNPLIRRDFNTKSFINCHDFKNFRAVIDHVKRIDQDDRLYAKYLKEPWYPKNKITPYADPKLIIARFKKIFYGEV